MPKEAKDNPQTAPELPAVIAKQYGLTHHQLSTTQPTSKPPKDTPVTDDSTLDQAVDDILDEEKNSIEDPDENVAPDIKNPKRHGFFGRLFRAKWFWYSLLLIILSGVAVAAILPKTRYAVLNQAGVRSTASVTVVDGSTTLPLKNVHVSIGQQKRTTDKDGVARFTDIQLGNYTLTIERAAFASYTKPVTIGWGSNPLGKFELKTVGVQYIVQVQDYLSGKPLANAEVDSEGYVAMADADGKVTVTRESAETSEISALVSLSGYRTEAVRLKSGGQPTIVQLLPDAKVVYVLRASGKYDVYSSDVDGNGKKLILLGTGHETSAFSVVVNPDNTHAAVVSIREAAKSQDGGQVRSLTFVDIRTGTSTLIERAEQIQLIDWIGDRLIYRTTTAGLEDSNPTRNKLIAYNFATNARLQLAAAEQFVFAMSAKGSLYYAPSGIQKEAPLGLYKVQPDGSNHDDILQEEVWSSVRTNYNTLAIQAAGGWYSYTLGGSEMQRTTTPPVLTNLVYVDNQKQHNAALIAPRDGKADITLREGDTDAILASQVGATYPLYWIDSKTIAYTVATATESALYVISTAGGQPRKVADSTPVFGFSRGL